MAKAGLTADRVVGFLVALLFLSLPVSIAGDDGATILLYLVFLVLLKRGHLRLQSSPILIGMGLLFLGFLMSSLASSDPLGNLGEIKEFWRFGLPFLLAVALAGRAPQGYLRFLLYTGLFISGYGVIQYFTGIDLFRGQYLTDQYRFPGQNIWHAVGAFSHHLTFGGVMLLFFALFFALAQSRDLERKTRILYWAGAFAFFLAAVLSHGRSVWLGLMTGFAVILLLRLPKKFSLPLILAGILVIVGFWSVKDERATKRILSQSGLGRRILSSVNAKANQDRLLMWKAGVLMIEEEPFLGFGPKEYERKQQYYDLIAKKYKHEFQHPAKLGVHNLYLQSWIDYGLIGLLGLVGWQGTLIFLMIRRYLAEPGPQRSEEAMLALGIAAAMAGSMVQAFFEHNFFDGEVQAAILTLHGIGLSLLYRRGEASTHGLEADPNASPATNPKAAPEQSPEQSPD